MGGVGWGCARRRIGVIGRESSNKAELWPVGKWFSQLGGPWRRWRSNRHLCQLAQEAFALHECVENLVRSRVPRVSVMVGVVVVRRVIEMVRRLVCSMARMARMQYGKREEPACDRDEPQTAGSTH